MPKAIVTKFIGPTTHRGARIKAFDLDGNSVTVPYKYEGGTETEHRHAAVKLCTKMGWPKCETLVGGAIRKGYAFVWCDGKKE